MPWWFKFGLVKNIFITSRFAASACGGPRAYGPRSTGLRPVSGPPAYGRWACIRALRAQMKPEGFWAFGPSSAHLRLSRNKRSRALRARAREDMLIRFKLMVPSVPCSIKFVVSSEIFHISQDRTFYIKIDIFHIRKNAFF